MPDQPYTIRDGWYRDEGGAYWQAVGVAGMPAYEPCFVVTGDLDAARRRLAPLPADTRAAAVDAAIDVLRPVVADLFRVNRMPEDSWNDADINVLVVALVAAGLIRPAHDDAAIERAARAVYLRHFPTASWDSLSDERRAAYIEDTRAALAAAEEGTA